jgi:hypothetical protein
MNKSKSQKTSKAPRTCKTPAALNTVKLTIEIPKNIMFIIQACAIAQEITVEENLMAWIKSGVQCDLECFESDCADTIKAWTEGRAK